MPLNCNLLGVFSASLELGEEGWLWETPLSLLLEKAIDVYEVNWTGHSDIHQNILQEQLRHKVGYGNLV